jgi:hypothetical protein
MNETNKEGIAFGISIGLAFTGGYADASSYLLAAHLPDTSRATVF